jgi:hypothetical protein
MACSPSLMLNNLSNWHKIIKQHADKQIGGINVIAHRSCNDFFFPGDQPHEYGVSIWHFGDCFHLHMRVLMWRVLHLIDLYARVCSWLSQCLPLREQCTETPFHQPQTTEIQSLKTMDKNSILAELIWGDFIYMAAMKASYHWIIFPISFATVSSLTNSKLSQNSRLSSVLTCRFRYYALLYSHDKEMY